MHKLLSKINNFFLEFVEKIKIVKVSITKIAIISMDINLINIKQIIKNTFAINGKFKKKKCVMKIIFIC